jgi:hypothetical protein
MWQCSKISSSRGRINMKNKIFSIINIIIDIIVLITATFAYSRVFQKAFNKSTLCGIEFTFWWMAICIIGALTLSKDIKKVGELVGK